MATLFIIANFMLILSFLVIIHELGHFLTAKRSGIKVEEFGMGYPPRALTLYTDKEGTEYTLNWLPFGGFVRMFGEDGVTEEETETDPNKAFFAQPVWQRLIVVFAGAVMNFVFGAMAFAGVYTYFGEIPEPLGFVRIEAVEEGSPAEIAGLKEGDEIIGAIVDGKKKDFTRSHKLINVSSKNTGKKITVLLNDGREIPVEVRSQEELNRLNQDAPPEEQRGAMGISIEDVRIVEYPLWQLPFQGIKAGIRESADFLLLIYEALGSMMNQLFVAGEVPKDVAGPVGVADQAVKNQLISPNLFSLGNLIFAAILSLNLAAINIVPLPALDGGRAVFLIIEGILKKRVKPQIEQWVNAAGFILLVSLLLLITVKDVSTILKDAEFFQWVRSLVG